MKSNWSTTSRHERGYGTAWNKIRVQVLKRDNGMCQCEQCNGIRYKANEVHHITSKAKAEQLGWTQQQTDAMTNLQSVNATCHKRITMAEQGKTLKPKYVIGVDGYPIKQII